MTKKKKKRSALLALGTKGSQLVSARSRINSAIGMLEGKTVASLTSCQMRGSEAD